MLNFAICDDNIVILNKLSTMLETIFTENNYDAKLSLSCTTAEELLSYLGKNKLDVLLLDINLNGKVSGLNLAKQIRKTNKYIYLIFSTAHLEYALLAYQLKTFDYLPKPITAERLKETVERILEDINFNEDKFIKIGTSQVIVKEDDVQYIKRDGMKLIYHTSSKEYETYTSFNKIQSNLPKNFVRCHKSYIANINNIDNIESNKNKILFKDEDYCFIGPKYKNNIMEVFKHGNFTNSLDSFNNRK